MSLTKSLVCAFHDGEALLDIVLPWLVKLPVDDFVFVFDNPSAEMLRIFDRYVKGNFRANCQIVILRDNPEGYTNFGPNKCWKYRRAYVFNVGFSLAVGDLIYVCAEDLILDHANFDEKFFADNLVAMVDFRYRNYNPFCLNIRPAFEWALSGLMDHIRKDSATQRSGVFVIRKRVFRVIGFEDVPTEEDWLRKRVVGMGFKHFHVIGNKGNWHLRPGYTKDRQFLQGVSRFHQGHGFVRVLGHTILWLKPYVLKGFLYAKLSN